MFRLGYNTNGLAHHRLDEALVLLAELGYRAVAITPDVGQLDLYRLDPAEVRRVRRLADELDLALAIETGARFLMDPRRKHAPTLLEEGSADRRRRIDFLTRSIDLAVELGAPLVSIWSGAAPDGKTGDPSGETADAPGMTRARDRATRAQGAAHRGRDDHGSPTDARGAGTRAPRGATSDPRGTRPGRAGTRSAGSARAGSAKPARPSSAHVSAPARAPRRAGRVPAGVERLWDRLVDGLVPVLDHAARAGVRLGFEPEPGMFLERPTGYLELVRRLGDRGEELGLTLDVGHLIATGDVPVEDQIHALAPWLVHVQLDDAPAGRHEHRMFGTGVLDLASTLRALEQVGFDGIAAVELSRDSHRGAGAAEEALEHLHGALHPLPTAPPPRGAPESRKRAFQGPAGRREPSSTPAGKPRRRRGSKG